MSNTPNLSIPRYTECAEKIIALVNSALTRAVPEDHVWAAPSFKQTAIPKLAELLRRHLPSPPTTELLDLLTLALPYIEEGEKFDKPNAPKLSAKVRAAIIEGASR